MRVNLLKDIGIIDLKLRKMSLSNFYVKFNKTNNLI